jgi:sortase A
MMTHSSTSRNRLARKALRVYQVAFLTLGTIYLGLYAVMQADASIGTRKALMAFESMQGPAGFVSGMIDRRTSDTADQSLWSDGRIKAYEESLPAPLGTPDGVLRIRSVELKAPIFDGTSDLVMNRGLGRIEGTAHLDGYGNVGIAGHRDGLLRALKDVEVGDTIELVTRRGARAYRITELTIVDPTDVSVLDPTEQPSITLVTCYPFYFLGHAPQRFIVRGVLENTDVSLRTSQTQSTKENNNVST